MNAFGPYPSAEVALEELRKAVAVQVGAENPATWPEHGNLVLAVCASLELQRREIERLHQEKKDWMQSIVLEPPQDKAQ